MPDKKMPLTETLKELNWTKAAFARQMGVDASTVYRWCKTEPRYVMVYVRLLHRLLTYNDEAGK